MALRNELKGLGEYDDQLKVINHSLLEFKEAREELKANRSMQVSKGIDVEMDGINKSIELLEKQKEAILEQQKALEKSKTAWGKFGSAIKNV